MRQSTKVIRRHVHKPLEKVGELLDAWDELPPPKVNLNVLDRIVKERRRHSGGRK